MCAVVSHSGPLLIVHLIETKYKTAFIKCSGATSHFVMHPHE